MKKLLVFILVFLVSGCSIVDEKIAPDEILSRDATLAATTNTVKLLSSLPKGEQVLTVSAYKFEDMTGQAKPAETAQSSRAVTQGGLAILKKALMDAGDQGWFDVLERGDLESLLQERQIVRTMREAYSGPKGEKLPDLPPLKYAGMLFEGGIVAYESNVMTGGTGARFLGIGGQTQYSRDMVTVYLRAVSVTTGEVLINVNTSKTIYSRALSGGLFQFVSYDQIAEGEHGVTYNEPPQLAVREAIEMAVYALIMEGYNKKLWDFKEPGQGAMAYKTYVDRYHGILQPSPSIEAASSQSPKASLKPEVDKKVMQAAASPTAVQPLGAEAVLDPKKAKSSEAEEKLMPGFYVFVLASMKLGDLAKSAQSDLMSMGFPVSVQKVQTHEIEYYRIYAGGFRNLEDAQRCKSRIRADSNKHFAPSFNGALHIDHF